MKKYNVNDLYIAKLYVVTDEEYIGSLTTRLTSEFLDFTIVKYKGKGIYSAIYKDIIIGRQYETNMRFEGQIYVNPESLINLNKITEKEKITLKELQEILNIVRSRSTSKYKTTEKRLKMLGLVLSKFIVELGEEKASMILNQIIEEIGIEKTQEITNPLSELLGYNVVEKAKNIERTRKK